MLSFLTLAESMAGAQAPALPTVRGGTQGTPESPSAKAITAPTEDNPEATAAEATGPIPVAETVSDDSVRRKLEGLLPQPEHSSGQPETVRSSAHRISPCSDASSCLPNGCHGPPVQGVPGR